MDKYGGLLLGLLFLAILTIQALTIMEVRKNDRTIHAVITEYQRIEHLVTHNLNRELSVDTEGNVTWREKE